MIFLRNYRQPTSSLSRGVVLKSSIPVSFLLSGMSKNHKGLPHDIAKGDRKRRVCILLYLGQCPKVMDREKTEMDLDTVPGY